MGDASIRSLDERTLMQWKDLSARCAIAGAGPRPSEVNEVLLAASAAEPQSPISPAYLLWAADNLACEGRHVDALDAYARALDATESAPRLMRSVDLMGEVLRNSAASAEFAGDVRRAILTYRDLARHSPNDPDPFFRAGLVAERAGMDAEARQLYADAAAEVASPHADDPAQLARRSLARLEDPDSIQYPTVAAVAAVLTRALENGDAKSLRRLVTKTHFSIGVVGGHFHFEERDILEHLLRDLPRSHVSVHRRLRGHGRKRYLFTEGWGGEWFRGEVLFMLSEAPKGWQWTGSVITDTNGPWEDRWKLEDVLRPADPAPVKLEAPWPVGQHFMAGGWKQWVVKQAAAVIAGPFRHLVEMGFARNNCGFGPRGFYYNHVFSHSGRNAFAVDFTSYRPNDPRNDQARGTPVLAAHAGIVSRTLRSQETGSSEGVNLVEIEHVDPGNPFDDDRFTTRYLHLDGPQMVEVHAMQWVIRGQRLGVMDSTGNSAADHLHFSLHDRELGGSSSEYGDSIRPSPLGHTSLNDGKCVRSNNVERTPGFNVSPLSINFNEVPIGGPATAGVVMENNLGSPVSVSIDARATGPITWNALNVTLAVGDSITQLVDFDPTDESLAQADLVIESSPPLTVHTIPVSGRGKGGGVHPR